MATTDSVTYRDRDVYPYVMHTISETERVVITSNRALHIDSLGNEGKRRLKYGGKNIAKDYEAYHDTIVIDIAARTFSLISKDMNPKNSSKLAGATMRNEGGVRVIELTNSDDTLVKHAKNEKGPISAYSYGTDFESGDFSPGQWCTTHPTEEIRPGSRIILLSTGLVRDLMECDLKERSSFDFSFNFSVMEPDRRRPAEEISSFIISVASNFLESRKRLQCSDHSVIIWDVDPI